MSIMPNVVLSQEVGLDVLVGWKCTIGIMSHPSVTFQCAVMFIGDQSQ